MVKKVLAGVTLLGSLLIMTAGVAGASGLTTAGMLGNYGFDPSALPPKTHLASLGDLYAWANKGEIKAATINTSLSIVLFSRDHTAYISQYIGSTSPKLSYELLHDGVNVTISTSDALASTGSGGSIWWPLGIMAGAFIGFLYLASLIHGAGDGRSKLPWKRFRLRRKAEVGVHHANDSNHEDIPTTTFADVAGVDEAVESLREIVAFLKEPERFARVGAKVPKGALMVGPPGTGKTLLARAVAGEAKVPFFSVSGSDFVEMYVGVGAKRVRELFGRARRAKRAIVFIDEIDAVARKRSSGHQQVSDSERDSTLIALLNELDGFSTSGVIVLAATNRADVLDPAIIRPGRLDRRVEVPPPDRRGREHILRIHAKERAIGGDVDLAEVSRRTSGMSGADLANVVNEACIHAARRDASEVNANDFDSAIMTIIMGQARLSAVVSDKDRLVTAWHEAGHTICALMQEAADQPISVSIIPRGHSGGVTAMEEGDNNFLQRSKAGARLVSALGGRCAEEMLLGGDYTQGAYGDLQGATSLATSLVAHYAMSELGLFVFDAKEMGSDYNSHVQAAVEKLLGAAKTEASRILLDNRQLVKLTAEALLKDDTLDGSSIRALYEEAGSPEKVTTRDTLRAIFGESSDKSGEMEAQWIGAAAR